MRTYLFVKEKQLGMFPNITETAYVRNSVSEFYSRQKLNGLYLKRFNFYIRTFVAHFSNLVSCFTTVIYLYNVIYLFSKQFNGQLTAKTFSFITYNTKNIQSTDARSFHMYIYIDVE